MTAAEYWFDMQVFALARDAIIVIGVLGFFRIVVGRRGPK